VPAPIRPNHPLRRLFAELLDRNLADAARVRDPRLAVYIAGVLTDFLHTDNLYRVRNARGKRLEDVGEMLIESNPLLEGRSFIYERQVRKHVGDYTLFLTGLFPEYVARLPKQHMRMDAFVDYMQAGKESYKVVSSFDQFEFRDEAPTFRRLSEQFELCVFGLNLVKADLQRMQQGAYREMQRILET
jgi:hypothetical protein